MDTAKLLNDFTQQFSDALPPPLKALRKEFEQQFQQGLKLAFSTLSLVTREEFDVQVTVLAGIREKVAQLEQRLQVIETELDGKI